MNRVATAASALRLLGVAAWGAPGGTWHVLARKDAVLLARLALSGLQPRQAMAAWLWPEVPAPRAHANLRQRLFRLRRQCGELIEESDAGLRLAAGVDCDLRAGHCSEQADLSARLLDGLPEAADEVQAWLDEARRAWDARRLDLLAERAEAQLAAGRLAAALASTEQLLAAEPLQEHAWRRLMRLHSLRGDRAAALAAFERCERVLRDELGVKPSPETLALLHGVETLAPAVSPPLAAPPGRGLLPAGLLHPPRLVGREAERRLMASAWQAGAAFVLVGVAGQGKSRLLGELAAQGPGRVLESARPGDESLSYGALARLLRGMHRAAPRPDALWPTGPAARELSRLLPELGSAPPAPGLEALLHGAIEQVFENAPRAGLQALLFDDLQHADEATRTVLRRVMGTGGLLWGLACRPDSGLDLAGWLASSARLQPVPLSNLDEPALRELLASLQLPPRPGLDAQALARHCGGNPLFVLETLKHLVLHPPAAESGSARLPLPASVEALLAQRLGRLGAGALNLARVAAVAGADFHAEVAADVLGTGLVALADPWAELQQAQVLRAQAGSDDDDEIFAHESLRDAVLQGVPQPLRAPLHARVARSLRERGAPPQRVAMHYAAAGEPAAAAAQALAAAALALRLGRTGERLQQLRWAAGWFADAGDADAAFDAERAAAAACLAQEGLEAAQQRAAALLARARTPAQRVAVRLTQAELGVSGYDAALALAAATAALAEAEPGSVEDLRARVLQATALARGSDVAAALAAVRELQPRLLALDDAALAAGLWAHCAVVFNSNGDFAACVQALEQQRVLARSVGHSELEAAALASLGTQHAMLGEVEAAVELGQQAVEMHRRLGADHTALVCGINLAVAQIATGELCRAQQGLGDVERALRGQGENADLLRVVAEMQAATELRLGCAQPALERLEASWPAARDGELALPRQLNRLALRGEALRMDGDGAAAARCWQALGERVPRASATGLHLRCRVLASQVLAPEAALAELDAVLAACQASTFPAGEALARMQRAECRLRQGRPELALPDALALQALRPRARHLFVAEVELRGLVLRVLRACGQDAEARAWQAQARAWLERELAPRLPPGREAAWRTQPAVAALLDPGPG